MLENTENELSNIFEEKLYVSKRSSSNIPISHSFNEDYGNETPDQKIKQTFEGFSKNKESNFQGKLRDITNKVNNNTASQNMMNDSSLKYLSSKLDVQNTNNGLTYSENFLENNPLDDKNSLQNSNTVSSFTFDSPKSSSYITKSEKLDDSILMTNKLPKETSLEGIYDDIELKDVLITKNRIESENKRVSFKDNLNNVCFVDRNNEKIEIKNFNKNIQPSQNLKIPFETYGKGEINNNTMNSSQNIDNITFQQYNPIKDLEKNMCDYVVTESIEKSKTSCENLNMSVYEDKVVDSTVNPAVDMTKTPIQTNYNTVQTQLEKTFNQDSNDFSIREKKIKELEKEFDLIIQTQKDVLRTKSKLYQFIYSEIRSMRKEFSDKTLELEKENKLLKDEVKSLKEKMHKMKDSVSKYNESVLEKIEDWKKNIKIQISRYLKNKEQLKET